MKLRILAVITVIYFLQGCSFSGCERYASNYSCFYVINNADYEVWYWSNLSEDQPEDNQLAGQAVGLRECENVARRYAAAIDEPFNYRAYICILMEDGKRMEKHRYLE